MAYCFKIQDTVILLSIMYYDIIPVHTWKVINNYSIVALILYTVLCGAPKPDETVHYLTYNSTTLEGSNVTYRCSTDVQLNTFTSVCYKNASWIPDPISQCAALQSGNNYV